ncbi:MAG: hypothetical protein ABSH20_17290 [Tepidisphaeraceae bacterium]|jgi:hypothetical protein
MAREKEPSNDSTVISFRLDQPHLGTLQELAATTKDTSIHEMARLLLIISVGQQPLRDALGQVSEARADIEELRKCLARSVEAILINLKTDLPDEEIKHWVFQKLWPQSEGGAS